MPDDPGLPGNPNGEGAIGFETWSKAIPQELAAEKVWEPLKDKALPDVLKGYVEAQKMIGGSLRIPKDDAAPEEWAKFYSKLGRPETPDKYEYQPPALPEGMWDKDQEKQAVALMHELGLNSKQVQRLMEFEGKRSNQFLQNQALQRKANVEAVKQEWGVDFPRRTKLASDGFLHVAKAAGIDKEALEFIEKTGMGDHPVFLKLFHRVGEMLAEDGWIGGDVPGFGNDAQAQINTILGDQKHPYWDARHPEHAQAVAHMRTLHQRAEAGRK